MAADRNPETISKNLTAIEQGGIHPSAESVITLFTQAKSFPGLVAQHEGLLRGVDSPAAGQIISDSIETVRRQQEEAAKKHPNKDPNSPLDEEDLKLAKLMRDLEQAKLEQEARGKASLGKQTTIDGKQAIAYNSMADFKQDAVNIVDRAGKSGQGAAELISIMEANKNNPNPEVEKTFERELKYQYDHATSSSEKEHLGLVAATYAKNDMKNISASADPETKSFFMGMALNPKYADLPKEMLQHPETKEQYGEFIKNTTAYVQGKVKDDPSAKNLAFLSHTLDLKVANVDNDLKTPSAAPAGASGKAMGSRTAGS